MGSSAEGVAKAHLLTSHGACAIPRSQIGMLLHDLDRTGLHTLILYSHQNLPVRTSSLDPCTTFLPLSFLICLDLPISMPLQCRRLLPSDTTRAFPTRSF